MENISQREITDNRKDTKESLKKFLSSKRFLIFIIIYSIYCLLLVLKMYLTNNLYYFFNCIIPVLISFFMWVIYFDMNRSKKTYTYGIFGLRIIFNISYLLVLFLFIYLTIILINIKLNSNEKLDYTSIFIIYLILISTGACYHFLAGAMKNLYNSLKHGYKVTTYYTSASLIILITGVISIFYFIKVSEAKLLGISSEMDNFLKFITFENNVNVEVINFFSTIILYVIYFYSIYLLNITQDRVLSRVKKNNLLQK